MDRTHLHALELRRSHERDRLARAATGKERDLRRVWLAQIEREIEDERAHLGLPAADVGAGGESSVDELFAELGGEACSDP
jgi:hypothetical protein